MIQNASIVKGNSPAAMLELVNEQICQNNEVDMFVTVWLGILELSTGRLVCANAGHEYPALKLNGGQYELFKDPHGFVIGGMEGIKYKEYELQLNPGDSIFVYTDGVAEAANENNELFGTDRMIETLNNSATNDLVALLEDMKRSIDEFAGDAPQFDDITMLNLTYYGNNKQ